MLPPCMSSCRPYHEAQQQPDANAGKEADGALQEVGSSWAAQGRLPRNSTARVSQRRGCLLSCLHHTATTSTHLRTV